VEAVSLLHPSRKRIRTWLDTGDIDDGLEAHVENCVKCSDELERIASGDDQNLEPALAELLAPPTDLGARMEERIAASFQARQDLRLLAGMFGLSTQMARLLLEPPDDQVSDDR